MCYNIVTTEFSGCDFLNIDIGKDSSFAEKTMLSAIMIFLSVVVLAMLGFALGIALKPYTVVIGIALVLGASFVCDRKLFWGGVINTALLCAFAFVCRYFFDWSYDGMYYHKEAVIILKEGWNPLRQTALECSVFASYPDMSLWLENYPKGLWIFSAAIYSLTNHLETAKAVNILFMSAVFCTAYDVMHTVFGFKKKKSRLIAILFAINPVFLSQCLTFYNDQIVGELFIIALLLCLKLYNDCATHATYAAIFVITAISPLIKFTAPALLAIVYIYFGILCTVKHKRDIIWMKKPVVIIVSAFLAGVFVFGFDPYSEHVMNHQHIIHPVMGKDKYDIMNTNPPKGFDRISPVSRLVISLFSKSSDDKDTRPQMKIPFTVSKSEVEAVSKADTRIGGFGVLFSGVLLLAIYAAIRASSGKKPQPELTLSVLLLLGLATLFPESWWARYASFIYYLPIFLLVGALKKGRSAVCAFVCMLLVAINSGITLFSVVSTGAEKTAAINEKLKEIKAENKKVIVRVNDFPTHVKLFEEYGIDFEVSHHSIAPGESIFFGNTKYKFVE